MKLLIAEGWDDYELLDTGDGKRFERFGPYRIVRPDPQCIWQQSMPKEAWEKADAVFEKNQSGHEQWVRKTDVPHKWLLRYNNLSCYAKLSPFKHTGLFPEQHIMWDWMIEQLTKDASRKANEQKHILNLFGYTGIASLVCAASGAKVTHVDASYPTIGWARENQEVSKLSDRPIRWIEDDCVKFVTREKKRGVLYDGIIMDPPVFGHGPKGERWEFFQSFPRLLQLCSEILVAKPTFILINAYAISASSIMLGNILSETMQRYGGVLESGELALQDSGNRLLSTGIYARWHK